MPSENQTPANIINVYLQLLWLVSTWLEEDFECHKEIMDCLTFLLEKDLDLLQAVTEEGFKIMIQTLSVRHSNFSQAANPKLYIAMYENCHI